MATFEELQANFLKTDKALQRAIAKNIEARKVRDAACPHTEVALLSTYIPGDYLNTSYTDFREECKICGKLMNSWTQDHGQYG